jgi:pimeloyl-ACP methyl ester carboxylesterase
MTSQIQARNGSVDLVAEEWPGRRPGLPLVVALHGIGLGGGVWAGLAERLADCYRLIAPDLRGHGASAKPVAGYGLADMTEDLRVWLRRAGAERATLVAHSFSARVALDFAAQFPNRVERLVLLDVLLLPRGVPPEIRPGFLERLRSKDESWPSREVMLSELRERKVEGRWRSDWLRWYVDRCTEPDGAGGVRLIWMGARMAVHVEETYAEPRLQNPWTYLPAVTCPTLVIRGKESNLFSREAASQLVAALPTATLVEMPGTHNLALEHPDEVEALIAGWLTGAK